MYLAKQVLKVAAVLEQVMVIFKLALFQVQCNNCDRVCACLCAYIHACMGVLQLIFHKTCLLPLQCQISQAMRLFNAWFLLLQAHVVDHLAREAKGVDYLVLCE